MANVVDIEGIGAVYEAKLKAAGVGTVEALLKKGASPAGRAKLAEATGISGKRILRWVNMADLYRIEGVAEEYSDLLEAAGVDTVVELAQRNPEHLHKALADLHKARKLVRVLPPKDRVADWIRQAKDLPRVVTY